jgi:hypothetical protein
MEATPLRPVPSRPAAPVDPAIALPHLEARLPQLPPPDREALALIELAGWSRAATAAHLGVEAGELARLLASARKALRQTLERLPGDGLCERAERLISDRLDGELPPRPAAFLDVHLRSCERCVTHERRLLQAHDQLVASLPAPALPVAAEPLPPPPLRVVVEDAPAPAAAGFPRLELRFWYALWSLAALAVVLVALLGAAGAV